MNLKIKQYADNHDLKSLKYIFVDSLDVDPTFVRYQEEYDYCKSIPGLLEEHIELTPFSKDKSKWNEIYWTNLKMDLLKNFSDYRMTHMKEVAKILLSDKVERILKERQQAQNKNDKNKNEDIKQENIKKSLKLANDKDLKLTSKQQQELSILKAKKELEIENRKIEEQRKSDSMILAKKQELYKNEKINDKGVGISEKKAVGIAVCVMIIVILILMIK